MADGNFKVAIGFNPDLMGVIGKYAAVDVKNPTQDEINKVLFQIEANAKQLAPVGTPESTHKPGYVGGRLRASILTGPLQNSTAIGGMVSTNVEYAAYVELGTRKMRARPFMETAAALILPQLEGNLGTRLDQEFTRQFKTL